LWNRIEVGWLFCCVWAYSIFFLSFLSYLFFLASCSFRLFCSCVFLIVFAQTLKLKIIEDITKSEKSKPKSVEAKILNPRLIDKTKKLPTSWRSPKRKHNPKSETETENRIRRIELNAEIQILNRIQIRRANPKTEILNPIPNESIRPNKFLRNKNNIANQANSK
jgi:hypothetical protein